MSKSLVIAEFYAGSYRPATLHAITAAQKYQQLTGAAYDILLLGQGLNEATTQLKQYGAKKLLVADNSSFSTYIAQTWSTFIAETIVKNDYETIFLTATTTGKDLAPCICARINAGQASDITAIIDGKTFQRPIYAGNVLADVEVSTNKKVITVRSTAFEKATAGNQESPIEQLSPGSINSKTTFLKFEAAGGGDRPQLNDAKVVISGGRGTKGDFNPVYQLADVLNAAVGASRAVVDAGWAPNDWQVGQTGKVVAPQLYIALGISGAIQHWAGMKDSKVIVAVNKDPEAPIMQLADYTLVADLFTAAPELASKLAKLKQEGSLSL